VSTSSQPLAQGVPRAVFTPEQTTSTIVEISHGLAELRLTMNTMLQLYNNSTPQFGAPPQQPLLTQSSPSVAFHHTAPVSYPYGMPADAGFSTTTASTSSSVPIHQLRFLSSSSQIPPWALTYSGPVYTSAPHRLHMPDHGAPSVSGTPYSSVAPSAPPYYDPGYEGCPCIYAGQRFA